MTYHGTYLVRISSLLTPRLPGLLFALYIYNAFVRVRVSSPLQRSFASSWASSGCRPCKSTTAARAGVCVVFAVNVLCVCCVCVCVCVFFFLTVNVLFISTHRHPARTVSGLILGTLWCFRYIVLGANSRAVGG